MTTPGFTAEKSIASSIPARRHVRFRYDTCPDDRIVPAYYCNDFVATCDCFGYWDCLKCTYDMWPRPCKNPFGS